MPWAPPRSCPVPGCPRLLERGERCPEHRPSFATSTYRIRPKVSHRLRRMVLRRDGYLCQRCGAPATDVDHVVPRHRGGSDRMDNLVSLCGPCHRAKTGREAQEARSDRPLSPRSP